MICLQISKESEGGSKGIVLGWSHLHVVLIARPVLDAAIPQPSQRTPVIAFLPPPSIYNAVVSQGCAICPAKALSSTSISYPFVPISDHSAIVQVTYGAEKAEMPW